MTARRPETLARALLRMLDGSPIDERSRTPVPLVFVDHDRREDNRRRYLAQRAVVDGIARRSADGLTRGLRLAEIETMRSIARVPADELAKAYDEEAAAEDARLAEMDAWMATWRTALGPTWRPRAEEPRRVRPTLYGPEPARTIYLREAPPDHDFDGEYDADDDVELA